jgi:hypothetical protein
MYQSACPLELSKLTIPLIRPDCSFTKTPTTHQEAQTIDFVELSKLTIKAVKK